LLHQLQHWNDKLLFESWGLQSILIGGKPGPKSGWYWRRLSPPFWWRLILLCATLVASTRGEGCGRPMASAEVPNSAMGFRLHQKWHEATWDAARI
jgi:hypothetical protein